MMKSRVNKVVGVSGGTTNQPHSGHTYNTGVKESLIKQNQISSENKNINSDGNGEQMHTPQPSSFAPDKSTKNSRGRILASEKFLNLNAVK